MTPSALLRWQVIIGTGFEVTLDMIKTLNISYVVSAAPAFYRRCCALSVCNAQVHGTHYDAPQTPDPYVHACVMSMPHVTRLMVGTKCPKSSTFSER
jgi:hypothetical protein